MPKPIKSEPDLEALFGKEQPKFKSRIAPTKITDMVMADALNRSSVKNARNIQKRDPYRIHVSDIISSDSSSMFCAREHVLNYHSSKIRTTGSSLSPGRELLFATGSFLGDMVIRKFLRNSPFAQYAYGHWICRCPDYGSPDWKGKHQIGTYKNVDLANVCKLCNSVNDNYAEVSVISKKFDLVGHIDFLLYFNGEFIVYEFKSIDRADVDFDSIHMVMAGHALQASMYYYILTEMGKKVHPTLKVVYIDRSNKKLMRGEPYKELACKPISLKYITQYTDRLKAVQLGKETRFLPPRICQSLSTGRSKNCQQALECFERRGRFVAESTTRKIRA